jgi:hypothetical protein
MIVSLLGVGTDILMHTSKINPDALENAARKDVPAFVNKVRETVPEMPKILQGLAGGDGFFKQPTALIADCTVAGSVGVQTNRRGTTYSGGIGVSCAEPTYDRGYTQPSHPRYQVEKEHFTPTTYICDNDEHKTSYNISTTDHLRWLQNTHNCDSYYPATQQTHSTPKYRVEKKHVTPTTYICDNDGHQTSYNISTTDHLRWLKKNCDSYWGKR